MAISFHQKILIDADLLKDKDKANWEAVVVQDLNAIWNSGAGRAVLNRILVASRGVKIIPFYSKEVNADATPRNFRDATVSNEPVRSGADGHSESQWGIGTGRGSAVLVRFTPWRFPTDYYSGVPAQVRRLMTDLGVEPGDSNDHIVVLLHELVHAEQQQRGQMVSKPLEHGFDTVAEFDAILVENIFRSEMGRYRRKNHQNFTTLMGDKMLPDRDLKDRLDGFRQRSPELAGALANIDTPFNPLRKGARGSR
jgi:hypothetical protein